MPGSGDHDGPRRTLRWQWVAAFGIASVVSASVFYWLLWGDITGVERFVRSILGSGVTAQTLISGLLLVRSFPQWIKGFIVGSLAGTVAVRVTRGIPVITGPSSTSDSQLFETAAEVETALLRYLSKEEESPKRVQVLDNAPPAYETPAGYVFFVETVDRTFLDRLAEPAHSAISSYVFADHVRDQELDIALVTPGCAVVDLDRQLRASGSHIPSSDFEKFLMREGAWFTRYERMEDIDESASHCVEMSNLLAGTVKDIEMAFLGYMLMVRSFSQSFQDLTLISDDSR